MHAEGTPFTGRLKRTQSQHIPVACQATVSGSSATARTLFASEPAAAIIEQSLESEL
jgi:hypothetical protein